MARTSTPRSRSRSGRCGGFPGATSLPYVLAQCVGATAAAFALRWLLGPVGGLGATVPALSLGRAFAVEFGYSALLAFVIMGVATDERAPAGVAPFAIGATVFAGALVTGPLTGGSFNPARSLGPALAGGAWTAHWLYWVAPIAGMVVAMHLYERLRPASAPSVPRGVPLGVDGPIARPAPNRKRVRPPVNTSAPDSGSPKSLLLTTKATIHIVAYGNDIDGWSAHGSGAPKGSRPSACARAARDARV